MVACRAFDTATSNGGVVHNVTYNQRTNDFIKVWPTQDTSGTWRITVLHKDANTTELATVTIRLPSHAAVAPGNPGNLYRLAPAAGGVFAKDGIDFGGYTFDGTEVSSSSDDRSAPLLGATVPRRVSW